MTANNTFLRKDDLSTIVASVSHNPVGRDVAFDYLRNNWQRVLDW